MVLDDHLKMKDFFRGFLCFALTLSSGCAYLHRVQIGEVDAEIVESGEKFEIVVSELGFNLDEAGAVAKALTQDAQTREQISSAQAIISLFQMGPRTGNTILDPTYADRVYDVVKTKCPSGKLSGLMSVRETAKYPVVSGEIVKVVGFCQRI